jgi:hypothetical protein
LRDLAAADPEQRDTTLLMIPTGCRLPGLQRFLRPGRRPAGRAGPGRHAADRSFHPRFQFAGTDARRRHQLHQPAPYPTLHLLREASIDRAVEAFPEAEMIYERNIETLERLGPAGWAALDVGPHLDRE